jgi:multicomponent Na+:H+ antiporter subunit E
VLDAAASGWARGRVWRLSGFLAFWLVLSGADLADLPIGIVAGAVATWASLRLLPPSAARVSLLALGGLALRFFCQSVVAGVDVARRALHPRLPLRPGFVAYAVHFPPGTARNAFAALTSLLPGTVPAAQERGELVYHCLDVDQPVVSQLTVEEAAMSRVLAND